MRYSSSVSSVSSCSNSSPLKVITFHGEPLSAIRRESATVTDTPLQDALEPRLDSAPLDPKLDQAPSTRRRRNSPTGYQATVGQNSVKVEKTHEYFRFDSKIYMDKFCAMERASSPLIREDLGEKMVFLGGPRQVGKTTLALGLLGNAKATHPAYLSWDDLSDRKLLLSGALPAEQPLLVFDEIHKYRQWRGLLKGIYDKQRESRKILVTGSARLDHYRKGGDSLQGRYHYHRLHPLSLHEISLNPSVSDLEQLLAFGGFPEPFLKANGRHWKRWQRERQSRVIQEDLISLEQIREVSQMELLASILPSRVGSPLSVNNLRQDLNVAFETADRYIRILENLYFCFRIPPHGLPKLRAAKKEQKLYMWDWSLCGNPAARLENLVASNLLKYCHHLEDTEGEAMSLRFLRDSVGREMDFIVTRGGKPIFAVECKTGDHDLSRNIPYFAARSNIPIFYQVHAGTKDVEIPGARARILPLTAFARILKI
jgi:predicted AAA+ superfamily ATPase